MSVREIAKKLKKEIKENIEKVGRYRKNLDENKKKLFEYMQYCMYMRDDRKKPSGKILTMICCADREVFKRNNITVEDMIYADQKSKRLTYSHTV